MDIIARKGDVLVVCEVKARASDEYGIPAEAITPTKQRRLRIGGIKWLKEHDLHGTRLRFDVACVLGTRLEIIENAF